MDPLVTLFDEDALGDGARVGLIPALQSIYGGDLRLPPGKGERPWLYANFVTTLDGVISYNLPNQDTGNEISGGNEQDHALMGILRSLADAVVWGSNTYQVSRRFIPTPAAVWSPGAEAFHAQRVYAGKTANPIAVIVTASGDIPTDGAILQRDDQSAIIATTDAGAARLSALTNAPNTTIWRFGAAVPLPALAHRLSAERGVRTLLCEGGSLLFGRFLEAAIMDELFLTLAPQLAGRAEGAGRAGLVEGVAFSPQTAPWARLRSLKRAANHLFLRYAVGPSHP
jgi:riboflavin biosynthesis pyrimidine reductase